MVRSSTRDSCTNQSEGRSTQEEGGATESCTNQLGGGVHTGKERQQTAAKSTQEGSRTREPPTNSKNVHTDPEKKRKCMERHRTAERKD